MNDLIFEHAPDGVRFEPLANMGKWYGGGTPSKSRPDYWKNGTIPWVSPKDMGRPIVCTTEDYITEAAVMGSATRLVPANSIAVVVRSSILDRILPTALIPVPVALNQDMKALVPREGVLPGYVAHVLSANGPAILRFARKTGGSVASIESNKLFSYRVPVPPPEVQREIVHILDHFTELEAELAAQLKAEIEARRRQYEHYRESLLTLGIDVQRVPLGELGTFSRGNGMQKSDLLNVGIPAIHYGQVHTHYGTWATETKSFVSSALASKLRLANPGDLVIATTSEDDEAVGKAVAWIGDANAAVSGDAYIYRHCLVPKFVAYFFQTEDFQKQKMRSITGTKVRRVSGEALTRITIPVPPREEQERIAKILDNFEALVNDLSVGLPAELAARRKQYEHYRDRLLTFEELPA